MLRRKFLTCTDRAGREPQQGSGVPERLFPDVLDHLDTDEDHPGGHNQQDQ